MDTISTGFICLYASTTTGLVFSSAVAPPETLGNKFKKTDGECRNRTPPPQMMCQPLAKPLPGYM